MEISPSPWGRPRFADPSTLEPEVLQRQQLLAETCAALGRCLFQASYYDANHPMAAPSIDEASLHLERLAGVCSDLTFAVEPQAWNALVTVEGAFAEPVLLTTLIGGLAGQQFSERMQAFMDTHGMVSFSLKTHMPGDEFRRFHEVFVQHLAATPSGQGASVDPSALGAQFLGALSNQRVFHASAIFKSDLKDFGRALPWRERLALARLVRDTRLLTLYTQLTPEQRSRAKLSLFSDILGLVMGETSLLRLLCNLDTVSPQVEAITGTRLDVDLFSALPDAALTTTGRALIELRHRLTANAEALPPTMRPDIAAVLLRNLALLGTRLVPVATQQVDFDLLRDLVMEGAVPVQSVPEWLQRRIQVERWLPSFLQNPQGYLTTTDSITDHETYWSHVMALVGAIPLLLSEERYDEAGSISRYLDEHRNVPGPFPERANLAVRAVEQLDSAEVAEQILRELPNASPERRDQLRRCSGLLGAEAVPALVAGLSTNGDMAVLSEVILALRHVGEPAREPIVEILNDMDLPPALTTSLMKVLGEVPPSNSTWEVLQRYVRHPHDQVRVAALDAVTRQWGPSARTLYMRALGDDAPAVVCKAIRALGAMNDRDASFVSWLVDLIAVDSNTEDRDVAERVQVAAIEVLASMGDMDLGPHGTLENMFLRRFEHRRPSRVAALVGKQTGGSEAIQVALCDALGLIGGPDALDLLRDTAPEGRIAVRSRMERAAARVTTRLGSAAA